MTKTFADMTPEERAECVGMWADCIGFEKAGIGIAIIDGFFYGDVDLVAPRSQPLVTELANVTPRFDLPRAWTPDGNPPSPGTPTKLKGNEN